MLCRQEVVEPSLELALSACKSAGSRGTRLRGWDLFTCPDKGETLRASPGAQGPPGQSAPPTLPRPAARSLLNPRTYCAQHSASLP